MTRQCNALIIGAGLAGSILAWRLREAGCDAVLIADPSIPSASRAAAGLINPVTGQRLVLQENIKALLSTAQAFYREIESRFGITLLHPREMLRIFRNGKERKAWEKRKENPDYRPYIADRLQTADSFVQYQTGHLDTNLLLDTLQGIFRDSGSFIESLFHHHDLRIGRDSIRWHDIEAERVIFCEGWRGQHNPWFSYLPFQPAKGEILTLHGAAPDRIINRGKWLLPVNADTFKLGATYDWQHLDEAVTSDAKDELTAGLPLLVPELADDAKVVAQIAGVRPGTRDKHPFLGVHPNQPRLAIFNGFGSKGSLLIPWHAEQFTEHLLEKGPLPPAADISRFDG